MNFMENYYLFMKIDSYRKKTKNNPSSGENINLIEGGVQLPRIIKKQNSITNFFHGRILLFSLN